MVLTLDGAADAAGVAGAWFIQTAVLSINMRICFLTALIYTDISLLPLLLTHYTHKYDSFTTINLK